MEVMCEDLVLLNWFCNNVYNIFLIKSRKHKIQTGWIQCEKIIPINIQNMKCNQLKSVASYCCLLANHSSYRYFVCFGSRKHNFSTNLIWTTEYCQLVSIRGLCKFYYTSTIKRFLVRKSGILLTSSTVFFKAACIF